MAMRARRLLSSLLLLAGAAGCGTADPRVRIDSDPPGATVYIDGERRGIAGDTFALHYAGDPNRRIFIQLRMPNHQPKEFGWEMSEVPPPSKQGVAQKVITLEATQ